MAGRGRKGRGGGGGGRGEMPREQQVSRKVSWLLRHGAEKEGLKLSRGGYVRVADALNTRALRSLNITFPELRQMVLTNDKQRFSLILASALSLPPPTSSSPPSFSTPFQEEQEDQDPTLYLIRANQGHSLPLSTTDLLTPILLSNPASLPPAVIHGTDERAWRLIVASGGLKRMTRNHVHFAGGLPAGFEFFIEGGDGRSKDADANTTTTTVAAVEEAVAQASGLSNLTPTPNDNDDNTNRTKPHPPTVISGLRPSSTILIYIDLASALEAGIPFFRSANGVILSPGEAETGLVPVRFFERVVRRKGRKGGADRSGVGRIVMRRGVVVDEDGDVEGEREMGIAAGAGGKKGGKPRAVDDSGDLLAGV